MKPVLFSPYHFVVYTDQGAELCAQRGLRDLRGRDAVYYPQVKVLRSHARRADWVYRPFLPRYMFLRDDGMGVSDLKRCNGVTDVVRAGLEPVRVRDAVLGELRDREDELGFIVLDGDMLVPAAHRFTPEQLVRVRAGEHLGRHGVFKRMSGRDRAVVFFSAAIGRVTASVLVGHLERVAC